MVNCLSTKANDKQKLASQTVKYTTRSFGELKTDNNFKKVRLLLFQKKMVLVILNYYK
jgi:hypothetical protein